MGLVPGGGNGAGVAACVEVRGGAEEPAIKFGLDPEMEATQCVRRSGEDAYECGQADVNLTALD